MSNATHKTRIRHPEKAHKPDNPIQRKPKWIRVKAPISKQYNETATTIRKHKLVTVCEEASCPNVGECWAQKHATFMILGEICTRACAFCNVATGKPNPIDTLEPTRIANAVAELNLKHVVITSVDRDDLIDGGAEHFIQTIKQIRKISPQTTIEILTPDFKGKHNAVEKVTQAAPDVFNHNLETIPALYPSIRPGARYYTSLKLLETAKNINPNIFTKTGLMVGLGEDKQSVIQVMDDAREAKVDFITIGQYLQPTPKHAPIKKFITPDEFQNYANIAKAKGFLMVSASPLTRSSYHAGDDFKKLQQARRNQL